VLDQPAAGEEALRESIGKKLEIELEEFESQL
jgi:hypothetical protein